MGGSLRRQLIGSVDALTDHLGRAVAWLFGLMAMLTLVVVVLRYGFDLGAIALQETVMYMHAITFMLGIPYALKTNAHVRVDVFYSSCTPRRQAWIDLSGHLLLLGPVCVVIFWYSLPYVASAWRVTERSPEVGGLGGVYLLKTLIPIMASLLLLQGVAQVLRCIAHLKADTFPATQTPKAGASPGRGPHSD